MRTFFKILLVLASVVWILSGNRAEFLIGFYSLFLFLISLDYSMPYRAKSHLDRPRKIVEIPPSEKILDGILILVMLALGVYVVVTNQ